MDIALTQDFLGTEEEADLITWDISDGAAVTAGQTICQFETSKLVTEFTAPKSGTLNHKADEGDVVSAGEVFATIS